jgi:hypothetical protein
MSAHARPFASSLPPEGAQPTLAHLGAARRWAGRGG